MAGAALEGMGGGAMLGLADEMDYEKAELSFVVINAT